MNEALRVESSWRRGREATPWVTIIASFGQGLVRPSPEVDDRSRPTLVDAIRRSAHAIDIAVRQARDCGDMRIIVLSELLLGLPNPLMQSLLKIANGLKANSNV
ncbi:hypothetical protein C8034_v002442 [Colletotrichum sidae]|uniref:Uncharacterized protein n=1 Tax=Colletotrichum sidae TaxID=1347389 RepID=A0A4R8TCC9_9PEZI|nr:hypothetical protein C8034_v002442 [Colletotrichum sidae]